ncbi:MAG: phasin family protein [Tropicimonas sp.]|uniref:phasin family protein n=1 Tax=Tropicimonas sp. TaxID=2067044 RepID=UPI003A84BD72
MERKSTAGETAAEKLLSLYEAWEKAGMGAWGVTSPRMMRQVAAMNAEMLRFVCDRFQQDLAFQSDALKCRNPAELQALQGRFFQQAFEQYCAEMGNVARMSCEAADTVSDPVPRR